MKKIILTLASLLFLIPTSTVFASDVGIGIFLSKLVYTREQSIDFSISAFNQTASDKTVDVHIGIISADGTIYEYPDWNTQLTPWLASFSIPANFKLPATAIDNLNTFPGGVHPGAYQFAVALTSPGTLNLLSFTTTPFKVGNTNNGIISGGVSLAHGESASSLTAPFISAVAGFVEVPANEVANLENIVDAITVNIEQCQLDKVPDSLDSNLDVGSSLLISSEQNEKVSLTRKIKSDGNVNYGISPTPSQNYYVSGQNYTASSTQSSDVGPFNISAIAPNSIIVTEPDLATVESINSQQDLNLRWLGNNGIGEITVTLQLDAIDESYVITCRFADDGEAIIPSSLLTKLRSKKPANNFPLPDIPDIPGLNIPDLTGFTTDPVVSLVFSRMQLQFINNNDNDTSNFSITWAISTTPKLL